MRRHFVFFAGSSLLWAAACDRESSSTSPSTTASTTVTSTAVGGGGAGASGASGGMAGMGGGGGGGGMTTGGTCAIGSTPAKTGGRVRVVAANLTSGNQQSYDGGHGVRILQGLDADVVLLQEMNIGNNSESEMNGLVDDICSGDCAYIRGPNAEIPNGVLTRLPILECGSWPDPRVSNRDFVWARIDIPGDADLWAISVHLLSSSASNRALEATSLLAHISGNIPTTDLIVLGGDLNTDTRGESGVSTLADVFETAGPYPVDHDGEDNTNSPRSKPYDWVLADAELAAHEVPVTIGGSVFANGAVIDTRVYMPLSEISPALSGDSDAPSMQHMAVVKDFLLE